MDYRNPSYNAAATIDCEINHPDFGWVPFTASPDDPVSATLYNTIIAAGGIAPYTAPPPVVPVSVSSRQFKMQLFIAGLKTQVEAWVATQTELVQIAYADSSSFIRTEPMMQQGFTDLGFTAEQIDQFFVDAAKL